jgi:hypothetical protein
MNLELDRLVKELELSAPDNERMRLEFGYACIARVRHLLEEPPVIACLDGLGAYLAGNIDRARFDALAAEAAQLANHHQGSKSIDGCGHAAVSASYAVAKALAGKAREAADYAAYATVYAQGGSAAVADLDSFQAEHAWQAQHLASIARQHASHA